MTLLQQFRLLSLLFRVAMDKELRQEQKVDLDLMVASHLLRVWMPFLTLKY